MIRDALCELHQAGSVDIVKNVSAKMHDCLMKTRPIFAESLLSHWIFRALERQGAS